ncbi:MAG: hypothetical protein EXQ59_01570 [Acidobacteria bacterium]|nr:hypothetical protein [Acidobacteriota bacterium]
MCGTGSGRTSTIAPALTGDPVTLADPVIADSNVNVAAVSASAGGLVAYRTGAGSRRHLTWVDRSGKALGALGAPDENGLAFPSVSPDGRRAVVGRTVQGNLDLWLLDGTRTSRFTFDAAADRFPIWSPDGSRIVFDSPRKGPRDLYQGSASRAGAEALLLAFPQTKVATDWSTASGAGATAAGGQWQVSTAGGIHPRWRRDGQELSYLASTGAMMAAPIAVTGASVAPGAPVALFSTRIVGGGSESGQGRHYDVTRDGRFLINAVLDEAAAPITLLQHWQPEAKK